jgi:hypothetical protein
MMAKASPAGKALRQRSAVTNGTRALIRGNATSAFARRWADIVDAHMSDLGGMADLTEAQLGLIKYAAGIEVWLDDQVGRMSRGEPVNMDEYGRAFSHLRRGLATLGIKREQRDVSPMQGIWAAADKLDRERDERLERERQQDPSA